MITPTLKKRIMILAWIQARRAANKFGGKAFEYFSECLKDSWELVKSVLPKPVQPVQAPVIDSNDDLLAYLTKTRAKGIRAAKGGSMNSKAHSGSWFTNKFVSNN